jgi:uncharacterized protein (TIGR03437 family)
MKLTNSKIPLFLNNQMNSYRFFRSVLVLGMFVLAISADAQVTLGTSNQNFTLTGIGGNSSGEGQSVMGWGSCAFDGTNTACTLSGPYTYTGAATALGTSGTYRFVVSYAGQGTFPLNAVSQTPGSNLFYAAATANYNFSITLTPTSGTPVNFYSFANFQFFYSSPTCSGTVVSSCGIGQVGLTSGAAITGPITGTFDPAPSIRTSEGVINASGYGGATSIAPGTWMEIYGVNLATTQSQVWASSNFNNNTAPESLATTSVTVGGQPSYIYYVGPGQINAQVPTGIATGNQPVVVTTAGGISQSYPVNVNAVQPGILAIPVFIHDGQQYAVSVFSNTLTFDFPVAIAGSQTAQAKPGDYLTFYGIGFGQVTPNIVAGQVVTQANNLSGVTVSIGGVRATVSYAGEVASDVGLYQINVVVPNIPANVAAPVVVSLNGTPVAQTLVIAVTN